ncbi:DUF4367 domain-containing protein [Paenibacillus tarimensis]
MRKTERDPLLRFKTEADESLFENLHFDSRMKERVMNSILSEPKQVSDNKRFLSRRKSRAAVLAAAVAVASAILFCVPLLQLNPDNTEEPVNLMGAPQEGGTLSTGIDDPPTTMVTPLPETGDVHDPHLLDVWELESVKEAKAWFGEGLMTASYTPDSYKLISIHASGYEKGKADQIAFYYASGDRFYELIQRKQQTAEELEPGEKLKADIAGTDGFFTSVMTDNDPYGVTVLQWFSEGIQYTVIGAIEQDKALQIAKSLQ